MEVAATTVDGSEILRAPVEVGSWNTVIYEVLFIPGARFLPSTVLHVEVEVLKIEVPALYMVKIREIIHKWRYPMKRWNRNALIPGKPYTLLTRWDYVIAKIVFLSLVQAITISQRENPSDSKNCPTKKHH